MVREGVLVRNDGSGEAGEGDVQENGDSCKLPSSPSPRNSSTSQRHFAAFRVRLAGGGEAEGALTAGSGGGTGMDTWGGVGGVGEVALAEALSSWAHWRSASWSIAAHWGLRPLLCGGGGIGYGLQVQ
jgi:hypothetical protein